MMVSVLHRRGCCTGGHLPHHCGLDSGGAVIQSQPIQSLWYIKVQAMYSSDKGPCPSLQRNIAKGAFHRLLIAARCALTGPHRTDKQISNLRLSWCPPCIDPLHAVHLSNLCSLLPCGLLDPSQHFRIADICHTGWHACICPKSLVQKTARKCSSSSLSAQWGVQHKGGPPAKRVAVLAILQVLLETAHESVQWSTLFRCCCQMQQLVQCRCAERFSQLPLAHPVSSMHSQPQLLALHRTTDLCEVTLATHSSTVFKLSKAGCVHH